MVYLDGAERVQGVAVERLLVERLLVVVDRALQVAVSSQQVAQQVVRVRLQEHDGMTQTYATKNPTSNCK